MTSIHEYSLIEEDSTSLRGGNGDPALLIVDDDLEICKYLQKVAANGGMLTEYLTDPLQVLDQLEKRFYNLVLLDVVMPRKTGIDLVPEIARLSPDTKIIIMSGYAEKEMAIKALRLGAFDFLEKPFKFAMLSHSLNRALDTQKTELEFKKTHDDLRRSRDNLLAHKTSLEQLNKQLTEANTALSVLAQNIDRTRQETEKAIVMKIRSLILPIIRRLGEEEHLTRYNGELTMLVSHVEDLTSSMNSNAKIFTELTSTELRIASLIKNGLSSEEIATHLYISPSTVKTHRKNIRRKLNLSNTHQNLRIYLQSKLDDGRPAMGTA